MKRLSFLLGLLLTVLGCQAQHSSSSDDGLSREQRLTLGDGGVSEFYSFTEALPDSPGVMLKRELLDEHLLLSGAGQAFRVAYTSTDGIKGTAPIAVSGAIFLPEGSAPADGWPLLIWSHGTVGIADICAPSWTGYVPFHQQHLSNWLKGGFAIAASDYQGLGTPGIHPYLATQPAAYSNLDLVRAIQTTELPISKQVLVAGQSQGASAAIATAGYWQDYAPEVDLRGVISTGVPYFSKEAIAALRASRPRDEVDPKLGYNFLILTLLEYIDPEFDAADHLRAEVLPIARDVASVCNRPMRKRIAELQLTYNDVFKQDSGLQIENAYRFMGFPTLDIGVPLFVGTGLADVDTPPRMQFQLVKAACAAGNVVSSHTYEGFDHLTMLNESQKDSTQFAKRVLTEQGVTNHCDTLPF